MIVHCPCTLREALEALAASGGDAVPLSGGTDLLVQWPLRMEAQERTYVDLSGVPELRGLQWSEDWLTLGGAATYWDVMAERGVWEEFPLLVEAARQVGAIQIQARGTWAGNIVNASPAADGVPVLMAYDAIVILQSLEGREEVPLERFYLGYKQMYRRPDQLVVAIAIPRRTYYYQRFEKVGARRAQAIAKVGLAITHSASGWRVVASSMAPTVRRCPAVERMLASRVPVLSPDDFLPAIEEDLAPIDDIRSSAEYRKRVMARLLYFDLREVCEWIR